MLLRRLETYGFKSFAEKTEVEFGSGITAIVGPNGSGKSNISDAIRWALGEQSIRTLRGSKAEDVIFAGSTKRRALGAAEVSLVFDNSDNRLPIDFNEVTITRRVFRSGDSEYYINKSACRLKDIHELLADTGLGRDSMSVIGQNKVDEVLNSKPEERRSLFEEVAGITKFKQRKKDALRKMEETSNNLNRVDDLMTEIESQLQPMAENAERTRTYNSLHQELVAYQATLLMNKLTKAEKMIASAQMESTEITDREFAAAAQMAGAEAEKERLASELLAIEENLIKIDAEIVERSTELERVEGKKAVLAERIRQSIKAQERLNQESGRFSQLRQELEAKLRQEETNTAAKAAEKNQLEERLEKLTAEYDQTNEAAQLLGKQIEEGKEQTFTQLQRIANERNELRGAERDRERLLLRKASLEKEQAQYAEQLSESQKNSRLLAEEQQKLTSCKNELLGVQRMADERKLVLDKNLQEAIRAERSLAGQLQEAASRLKILTQMQEEYDGFGRGIKQLLKTRSPWRNQMCGAVAELFTVDDQFVVAIETALGGALQHIITENEGAAKAAIDFLKVNKLGRATFLPITTIKPSVPRAVEITAAEQPGAVGFATDLVSCDVKYKTVLNYLLGRTVVATNIDTGLEIARKSSFSVRIVTLDGQQINPGGSLTGGSVNRRENSFLSRVNEIEALKVRHFELNEKWQSIKSEEADLKVQAQELEHELRALARQQQEADVRQAELAVQLERASSDSSRMQQAVLTLQKELEAALKEDELLQQRLSEIRISVQRLEMHDSDYKGQVQLWQVKFNELQAAKEVLMIEVTEIKIILAGLQQQIEALVYQCRGYNEQLTQLQRQMEDAGNELVRTTTEITCAEEEIAQLAVLQSEVAEQKSIYQTERQNMYSKKMNVLSAVQKNEKDIRDFRRKYSELQTRVHDMQLMMTKYQFEAAHCQEQLEQFGLTQDDAKLLLRPGSYEEISGSIRNLEARIAELGPVNPGAVEEYERLAERQHFLHTQSGDLRSARDYLVSIIRDIDQTMSKQFTTAFAVINEKFGETFSRLFGGGTAKLQLLEPENVLETGIDILVQPPGKKQQNLSLLSGGERALTVIALLFSFLAYRPAPFCVVDEIDAALDEANVERFSSFLRDYAKDTQFIVVTHRKGTMEAADVMQGVTMEESGISRLLSVKFMDKAV